jgi:Holliday junction resolvasome RuvABC DNA-binding subunit
VTCGLLTAGIFGFFALMAVIGKGLSGSAYTPQLQKDAIDFLVSLGFAQPEAVRKVTAAVKGKRHTRLDDLVNAALRQ